eukprot:gene8537-600_t
MERELAHWVVPYRELLQGWGADLFFCRETSHGLSEFGHEADRVVAHDWPTTPWWNKLPLRVELRLLNGRTSSRHKLLVRDGTQQAMVELWAASATSSGWLLRDTKPGSERKPGWPTPWRTDIHPGVSGASGPERLFALRLHAARMLDFATVALRVEGMGEPAVPVAVLECLRCQKAVEDATHWIMKCPGRDGRAAMVRAKHIAAVQAHIGVDLSDEDHWWWMVPLAAGCLHPEGWTACDKARGGKLQWADTRQKALYLMVRVIRMARDMWVERCREVYGFPEDSHEAHVVRSMRSWLGMEVKPPRGRAGGGVEGTGAGPARGEGAAEAADGGRAKGLRSSESSDSSDAEPVDHTPEGVEADADERSAREYANE